jgi:hypothetical protein
MSEAGQSRRHIEVKQSKTIFTLKRVEYNGCQAKHGISTPSMFMGEAQMLLMEEATNMNVLCEAQRFVQ